MRRSKPWQARFLNSISNLIQLTAMCSGVARFQAIENPASLGRFIGVAERCQFTDVDIILHHRDDQNIKIMKINNSIEQISITDGGALSGHLDVSLPRYQFTPVIPLLPLLPENSKPAYLQFDDNMTSYHTCPCCSSVLLRHISRSRGVYWRCSRCRAPMSAWMPFE